MKKIPVILDTDIGSDIDDTWALGFMLKCPELDVKLITTASANTVYRTKLVAKYLEETGRYDIPLGRGPKTDAINNNPRIESWLDGYDIGAYPGTIYGDGVTKLIDTIMSSPDPITLCCIGPLSNIAAALDKEPRIASKCHFVSMIGSIAKGHEDSPQKIAEWNVIMDIPAAQKVFSAKWLSAAITPLDSCGNIRLTGELYSKFFSSKSPYVKGIVDSYKSWLDFNKCPQNLPEKSSILYDTVAIYMCFARELLKMEPMTISIDDKGFCIPGEKGLPLQCAMDWKDKNAFYEFLVERLIS